MMNVLPPSDREELKDQSEGKSPVGTVACLFCHVAMISPDLSFYCDEIPSGSAALITSTVNTKAGFCILFSILFNNGCW